MAIVSPSRTPWARSARASRDERSSSWAYVTNSPDVAMMIAGASGVPVLRRAHPAVKPQPPD
jgi:hypothetical protein